MHLCIYVCVYVFMYVCIYIYACIYITSLPINQFKKRLRDVIPRCLSLKDLLDS